MQPPNHVREAVQGLLMDLIRIPSTRGKEGPAIRRLHQAMGPLVEQCELIEISDSIMQDPDYAFPLPDHTYVDTPNLECIIRGAVVGDPLYSTPTLMLCPLARGRMTPSRPAWRKARFSAGGLATPRGKRRPCSPWPCS